MKEGRYFSRTEKRYCNIYRLGQACECQICGKINKSPISLVWEDDEEQLENIYGTECIKKLELSRAKTPCKGVRK